MFTGSLRVYGGGSTTTCTSASRIVGDAMRNVPSIIRQAGPTQASKQDQFLGKRKKKKKKKGKERVEKNTNEQ